MTEDQRHSGRGPDTFHTGPSLEELSLRCIPVHVYTSYKIVLWCRGFGQEFFLSRPKYAIRGTGIFGRK